MALDFDDVLESVGSYGSYQKWLIGAVFVPISFFAAVTMNLMLFQVVEPDHWCYVPGPTNTTLTKEEWKALTIPRNLESNTYHKCAMYGVEWSDNNHTTYAITNETRECSNGWEHDASQFSATVATSFGWVCERARYSHHVLSVTMAGNTVGTFLLPLIADKYLGRKKVFFLSLAIHVVFTISYIWVSHIGLHLALRFFQGLSFETYYLMPYIIVLEMIPPEKRAVATMYSFVSWTIGMCFTALVAWLLPQWQYLAFLSCVPSIVGFLYWRYLPESPRWLLSKGQLQQCSDILLEVARINGATKVSGQHLESDLRDLMLTQPQAVPLTHACAYPKLRLRAVFLFIIAYCMFVVYGVLMLGINVMPSNYFLSHFILSASELPSNVLGWLITHYLGRRFMCFITYLLAAVFSVVATYCVHDEWLLMSIVAMVKLLATQGLYVVFLMASEIFPTPIRTSGYGITIVFGMLAMVVSPYILHSTFGPTFQYWVMVVLSLVSLLASIFLPETLGLPLPQTFQEAEDLGAGRPFTAWVHHWNQHKYSPHASSRPNACCPEELDELTTKKL